MAEKKKTINDLDLPDFEEAKLKGEEIFSVLQSPALQDFLSSMRQLKESPPQVLLFEAGTQQTRLALAMYWSCLLNCKDALAPCYHCQACLEIVNNLSADFFYYNCLENSLKIEDIRTLKPYISQKPNFLKQRIALFYEPFFNRSEAANAMLKILEEPNDTTSFVFTVSQRQSMLATILSRSFVLTLPSNTYRPLTQSEEEIRQALFIFFTTGREWFAKYTFVKGFSKNDAQETIYVLMQSLTKSLAYTSSPDNHALVDFFHKKIDARKSFDFEHYVDEAQNALHAMVNPALVIDTLLLQLFILLYEK